MLEDNTECQIILKETDLGEDYLEQNKWKLSMGYIEVSMLLLDICK